jgi:hypothetical protein
MSDKAKLEEIKFKFTQEGNCIDGRDEWEELEVSFRSDLGIDYTGGGFMTLKTEQWAFDGVEEMAEMLQRVQDAVDVILKNNPHKTI